MGSAILEEIKKIHTENPLIIELDQNGVTDKASDGFTLLHFAVREGRVDLVKWLGDEHPNLLEKKSNDQTPCDLIEGSSQAQLEILRYLLRKGCVVTEPRTGFGPFHRALISDNIELIKVFLNERPELVRLEGSSGLLPCGVIAHSFTELKCLLIKTEEDLKTKETLAVKSNTTNDAKGS